MTHFLLSNSNWAGLSVTPSGADPGVEKGEGHNRLSVARWLEK